MLACGLGIAAGGVRNLLDRHHTRSRSENFRGPKLRNAVTGDAASRKANGGPFRSDGRGRPWSTWSFELGATLKVKTVSFRGCEFVHGVDG